MLRPVYKRRSERVRATQRLLQDSASDRAFIFLSTGVITVTMLKVAFVMGCLLALALAHPVSVILVSMFSHDDAIIISVVVCGSQ